MTQRLVLTLALLPCLLTGVLAQAAPAVTDLRLLSVTKSDATLSVDLASPAGIAVQWGETPGEWTGHAEAPSATDHHQVVMGGLSPDVQYFYRLVVEGTPSDDMLTFRSGRSWVTRRARVLVTADVPGGDAAGEKALADRMFATEADALVVLGGDAGKPADFARMHERSLTDRVVLAASGADAHLGVADVKVVSGGALPSTDDGTCWRVGLGATAPAGVEVSVTTGPKSSIETAGDAVKLVLAEPDTSGGPRTYARLDFVEGQLTATLVDVDGNELGNASLKRTCAVPKPKAAPAAHASEDGEADGSSDAEADAADCPSG